jgi:redox-sensing transcriptional repressor
MEQKEVSQAVIGRLPRYYRYLGELMEEGVERISSRDLSTKMKVTSSQIRQDLNQFGGFGQTGYGYHVPSLYDEIGRLLGLNKNHTMIVIGAGNLGQALANYANFERRGFNICAMFDQRPELIGSKTIRDIPILDIRALEEYLHGHEVDIAVLAIPKTGAIPVAKRLVEAGIRAIWNFSHTDLEVPEDVMVENVHLSESLMKLSYRMKGRGEE